MADRALTEEAVLAGLQDIRLPVDAPGGILAELLVVIGLGLLLALVLGMALRTLSRPRARTPGSATLADRMARLSDLPDTERRLALLHLLKEVRPDAFKRLAAGLYRADGLPDAAMLEKALTHDG